MKSKIKYKILSFLLFLIVIFILVIVDKNNNIQLSLAIQITLILYLIKITWECLLYIKKQYKQHKYSYSIVMNLGFVLFLIINIFRQINLLINNWNLVSINEIYSNILNSFSYFAYLILPLIAILVLYSIFTNIFLIIKEGFSFENFLGIFFGICIAVGALLSQNIYVIISKIQLLYSQIYIREFINIALNVILCYFYCITIATLYCNIRASKHKPLYDKDFVIILGSQIRKDGSLTPLLKARVDKAIEFAQKQKEKTNKKIVFVPSGGKGEDEITSEAEAMKKYLVKKGINPEDILLENKSTNTFENMKYSKKMIDENNENENAKIIFSTTNYHVFRSGVIANDQGIDCEGIGSKTKWYFYANAIIREFIANLYIEKKHHLILITIINIIIFILVFIGYRYNLV